MDTIALRAEAVLRGHPHPALRLDELVELLARDVDRSLTAERLRAILEAHPRHFRVLDSWTGRWTATPGSAEAHRSAWVVAVEGPAPPPDDPRPTVCLRESVRWLGKELDPRSRLDVSRWYAIVLAERRARAAIARRAA